MNKSFNTPDDKKLIKKLKVTRAYAQYKTRSAGDLDNDLINWNFNITRTITKHESDDTASSEDKNSKLPE